MSRGVTAVVLAAILLLAGCSGPGDRTPQPLEGTASAATVGDDALSAAGYERVAVESDRVNRTGTIDVSGDVELSVDYQVRATARRAVYRTPDRDPPSVFALYSAPLVSPDAVATTIDPLGDRSRRDVVGRVLGTDAGVGPLDHVENATVGFLGNETTLAKYATTATVDGSPVDVFVYVAAVRHGGDVVWAVAMVPRTDDDPEAVRQLVEGARH